jgi:MFS family permease
MVALQLGLNRAYALGWTSPLILGLFGVSAALLAAFVVAELRIASPMLDLRLFRQRTFSSAASSSLLMHVALYSVLFLMPFYLIEGRGLTTGQAGLLLTSQPLAMAAIAPLSGALSDRIGSRILAPLGLLFMAGAMFSLSQLDADTPIWLVSVSLAFVGLGSAVYSPSNQSALFGATPANRRGIAGGMIALARNVGFSLGIGITGAIFTTTLAASQGAGSHGAVLEAVSVAYLFNMGMVLAAAVLSAIRESPVRETAIQEAR